MNKRIFSLDIARGIFILLMLAAHSIYFFHAGSNFVLQSINQFADMVSFSGLLFISGAASYISYIHFQHPTTNLMERIAKRIWWYIVGYFVLALISNGYLIHPTFDVIFQTLTFQKLAPFTEFLLPFLILGLLNIPLRNFYKWLSSSIVVLCITAVIFYIIGQFSYFLEFPENLIFLKAVLFGSIGWYSFPLFQYMPIYLFGIFIGRQLYDHTNTAYIRKLTKLISVLMFIVTAIIIASRGNFDTVIQRFPPAISFIIFGLGFAFLVLYLVEKAKEFKNYPVSRTILILFGQNTFAILFTHTVILFLFKFLAFPQVHSVILISIATLISTGLALYGAKLLPFNYQFGLTMVKWCECEITHCKHAEEHTLIVLLKKIFFSVLSIKDLLSIRIGRKKYFLISHWSAFAAGAFLLLAVTPLGFAENDAYFSQLIGALSGSTNRTWFITAKNESLTYSITIPKKYLAGQRNVLVSYVFDEDPPKQFPLTNGEEYTVTLPTDILDTDEHIFTTEITVNGKPYPTGKTRIYLSEPLIVTWTIDWEGYDVSNLYLAKLASISKDHDIPMTQLFNPEIFITGEIGDERKKYLTDWIIERRDIYNENIGLHLHMFPDLISSAGLDPKTTPSWGGGFSQGYDVLTTAYSFEEMVTLLEYSKKLFAENGLGIPRMYRAGGWFANSDTLKALEQTGFLLDTSGRTAYTFGSNSVKGPWDLRNTTQPYYPSEKNQNSTNPLPRLSLLEVPNNGADSYWFTGDEMIGRFMANYDGGLLTQPKQVTYLSHPHWFNEKEQRSMSQVFSHIDQFSYADDRGPAVYGTLLDVYEVFARSKDQVIN